MEFVEYLALGPTAVLLIIIISQYVLMMLPKRNVKSNYRPDISIIVPAHNEESNIEDTVRSLSRARYRSRKEIILVENGSTDRTYEILKRLEKKYPITVFRMSEPGKSKAVNFGIRKAKYDTIVICDADSNPKEDALEKIVQPLADNDIGAASGIVRIKNKTTWLTFFQSIEYAYLYFYNTLLWKIDGVIFTPGVLSVYKRDVLKKVGYFSESSITEDFKVALAIHRHNYKIALVEDAVSYTSVPTTLGKLFRQRLRWARGILRTIFEDNNIFLYRKSKPAGFYSLPSLFYWFVHAVIMIPIIFYLCIRGYFKWILPYSGIVSLNGFKYFFYWFSFFGILNLIHDIFLGYIAPNPLITMSIAVTFLTWPLYLYSVVRFDRKLDAREFLASFFLFPYSMFIAFTQIVAIILSFTSKKMKW